MTTRRSPRRLRFTPAAGASRQRLLTASLIAVLCIFTPLCGPTAAQTDPDPPRASETAPTVLAPIAAQPAAAEPDTRTIPSSDEMIAWDATDLDGAHELAQRRGAALLALFVRPGAPVTERLIGDLASEHRRALPRTLLLARIAADHGVGAEQARSLGVLDLPTAIVFDAQGIEIDRVIGYADRDAWRIGIQRAAGGHDPLPALLARDNAIDPHTCFESGWRLLVRGEVEPGMELLRRVFMRDDGNVAGHTVEALRLMARYTEEIRKRPHSALDYWTVLLEEHYDPASHAQALSALVRIHTALGSPEEGFKYLSKRARDRLTDYRRLDDLAAYAERTGFGTLEAAQLLRESLQLSSREETGGILLRLLLSEGRVWEAEQQVRSWRGVGWSGPGVDSLSARVTEARRRLNAAWNVGYDTPPQVERQIAPECPHSATVIGATGQVVVKAFVSEDGIVVDAILHSSSGVDALDGAALEAALQWRFRPAKRAGEPIATQVLIPLRFDCR